ncbi:DUF2505 domain-containing protein [Gordonia sp. NPDC003429]
MASKLEHTVTYPFTVARYWEIVSTEQYWHDLLEAINSSHGKLDSLTIDGDTVTVQMQQGIPESHLPPMVTKVRPGDLDIPRAVVFTRTGDTITGTITASISGVSAKVDGTFTVSGNPAHADYTAEVTVAIPFVGGKIEKVVINEIGALLDAEREQTVTWAADHP